MNTFSPLLRPYRSPPPYDTPTNHAVLNALLRPTGVTAGDVFTGRRWPGAKLTSGIVLAQSPGAGALAGPAPGLPSIGLPRIPGPVIGGAAALLAAKLLQSIASAEDRRRTEAALTRFALDRNDSNDVGAAYAYVWCRDMAPRLFPLLPWTERAQEDAAQAVMRYERAHPGTRDRAIGGDFAAHQAIMTAIEDWSWGPADVIHERRISKVADPALSTSSDQARAIVGPSAMQDWTAHHLIPFGVMGRQSPDFQKAVAASGWMMDSAENLIALPRNYGTFLASPNDRMLPYQDSSHPGYDADVAYGLAPLVVANAAGKLEGPVLRTALLGIETAQRRLIVTAFRYPRYPYYEKLR